MYANVAAGEIAALGGGGVYVGLGIADLARTYDFSENGTIIKVEEGNVVVSEFLRFKEDGTVEVG